jgi:hypothetical protein
MSEITIPLPGELLLSGPKLSSPAQTNRSTWTGRRKVIGLAGTETWRGSVAIADIATEADERQWRAFLFALAGPQNSFRFPLPCNTHIGPKPLVNGATEAGYTLPLDGMTPNARILRAGQYITVPLPSGHARAVCLTADLVSNGAGQATAQFRPALNEVPADNAVVETTTPYVPMSPVEPLMGLDTSQGISGTSFDVEESL